MKLEIEKFLEHIDEWKFKVHEELKGLSPAQRKAYWNRIHARGLNVVDAEEPAKPVKPAKPAKRPTKRVRRTG